jgi:DNA-binding transcriptional regulator YiaG
MAASDRRVVKKRGTPGRAGREEGMSPLIAEVCAGVEAFLKAAEAGESLEGLATIRTRTLELSPREYGPKEVRAVRRKLKASQALLAKFMGVNTQTVSSWEQGRRKVPAMARRYLDDLVDIPALWATRTGSGFEAK